MVVRVSKPSFLETNCKERLHEKKNSSRGTCSDSECCDCTDLLDLLTCDWFTAAVQGSLSNDDDVQAGAAASLLDMTGEGLITPGFFSFKPAEQRSYILESPAQMLLPPLIWRHLWNEHPVGSTGQSRHQGEVSVVGKSH